MSANVSFCHGVDKVYESVNCSNSIVFLALEILVDGAFKPYLPSSGKASESNLKLTEIQALLISSTELKEPYSIDIDTVLFDTLSEFFSSNESIVVFVKLSKHITRSEVSVTR